MLYILDHLFFPAPITFLQWCLAYISGLLLSLYFNEITMEIIWLLLFSSMISTYIIVIIIIKLYDLKSG